MFRASKPSNKKSSPAKPARRAVGKPRRNPKRRMRQTKFPSPVRTPRNKHTSSSTVNPNSKPSNYNDVETSQPTQISLHQSEDSTTQVSSNVQQTTLHQQNDLATQQSTHNQFEEPSAFQTPTQQSTHNQFEEPSAFQTPTQSSSKLSRQQVHMSPIPFNPDEDEEENPEAQWCQTLHYHPLIVQPPVEEDLIRPVRSDRIIQPGSDPLISSLLTLFPQE